MAFRSESQRRAMFAQMGKTSSKRPSMRSQRYVMPNRPQRIKTMLGSLAGGLVLGPVGAAAGSYIVAKKTGQTKRQIKRSVIGGGLGGPLGIWIAHRV
jgi:predicted lipid-binding transport protein (Tim44 family)